MSELGSIPAETARSVEELEAIYPTMYAQEDRIHEIYRPRGQIYLASRFRRIRLLELGVGDLFDSLRRDPSEQSLETALARVTARVFCIAEGVGVYIADGLQEKFPFAGCGYCQQSPCQCSETRSAVELGWGKNEEQNMWGLREWQQHLGKQYGEANRSPGRGIWFCAARLMTESSELLSLEESVPELSQEIIRTEYQRELADTLAWTVAAANILEVDLLKALFERFGNGCQVCGGVPCACGRYNFGTVKFE